MTPEELLAIRERLNKITPWPWERLNGTDVFTVSGATNRAGVKADENDGWLIASCYGGITFVDGEPQELSYEEQRANAEFIAHAPDDIKRLLDEVERLQRKLADTERLLNNYVNEFNIC
jgi:hypothetical protein